MRVFRAAQVFAFPIIDRERRITGVVDVSLFNEEVFGIPKTESGDELFQAIGFHISQARQASHCNSSVSVFPGYLSQSVRVQSAPFSPEPTKRHCSTR